MYVTNCIHYLGSPITREMEQSQHGQIENVNVHDVVFSSQGQITINLPK